MGRLMVGTLALTAWTLGSAPALAGPPLICHPFDIGPATSLPMGDVRSWSSIDPAYDRTRLVDDTLRLLAPDVPVIVRMETLRRASVYARSDRAAATRLLEAVRARATKAPQTAAQASALFDAGYLVETYRQMGVFESAVRDVAGTLDGYAMVTTAARFFPDDGAMALAGALITSGDKAGARYAQHARRARELASKDPLVARNLPSHLSD